MAAILFALISTLICIVSGIVVHYMIDNWLLRRERVEPLMKLVKADRPSAVR